MTEADPNPGLSPLSHEDARGLLDAYLDGELEADEAARVERHMAECERCKTVEAALGGGIRNAITGGEALSQNSVLPGVQRRLNLRSRGRFYANDEKRRGPTPWPLIVASVLVLALLVIAYLYVGSIAPTPPRSPTTSGTP